MSIEKVIFEEFSRGALDDANDILRRNYSEVEGHDREQARLDALDYVRILQSYWLENQETLLKTEGLEMTAEINQIKNICRLAVKNDPDWKPMAEFLLSEAKDWGDDVTSESHQLAASFRNLAGLVYP